MTHRNRLKHVLHILFILVSAGWLFYLFADSIKATGWIGFMPDNYLLLGTASLLLIMYLLCIGLNFHLFLQAAAHSDIPLSLSMRLHLVGQVARYLPGRFWGIAYQITSSMAQVSASAITRANIDLMLLASLGTTLVSVLILGIYDVLSMTHTISIVVSLITMLYLLLKIAGDKPVILLSRLRIFGEAHLPQRMMQFIKALGESSLDARAISLSAVVFISGWGLYLFAWFTLGQSFSLLENSNMLVLCSCYTLAWLIGFVSAITPGGLGVREAAFVLIAGSLTSTDVLAFLTIFMRLWLMLADLSLVLLIPVFRKT